MKTNYLLFILLVLFTACDKMNLDSINESEKESAELIIDDSIESLKSFAMIMSKALYNEPELRSFVKEEALHRKDLDYDVFYPWVKDINITEGHTFDDIIRKYDTNDELDAIIKSCPLLTILVPDWSWVNQDCFSPMKWDTDSPDVGVSYLSESSSHEIFHNGEYAFSMDDGEYSSAPILIVKNNERVSYLGETKSGEGIYYFNIDDYVDIHSEVQTKGHSEYETIDLVYDKTSNVVSTGVLNGRVATAYFSTNDNIPQRDHIYYGMTTSITSGKINRNYYERLHKIKISPKAKGVFDDPVGSTSTATDFKSDSVYLVGKKNTLSEEEIISKSWGEGSIELKVKIYVGSTPLVKMISVSFSDAFDVKQVEVKKNINWLGAVKSRRYYLPITEDLDASSCLEPKWINVDYDLFCWDASIFPTSYYVEFWESDLGTTVYKEYEQTYQYMTNFSTTGEVAGDVLKIGWSIGASQTSSKTIKFTESYQQEDDEFGNFPVLFSDKVILSQSGSNATIKTYSTGYIDAMIIPHYE